MRMRIGDARSISSASICLTVELRPVPLLTAAFGAYTMLEQSLRPATTRVKKQAFKKKGIGFDSNAMSYPPSRLSASTEPQEVPGRGPYGYEPGGWRPYGCEPGPDP